jgi:hypothetical protein
MKTQAQAIREYLIAGGTLTSMEAYERFGCTRLAVYIYEMRKKGFKIVKTWRYGKNRYGRQTRYAAYGIGEKE